MGGVRTATVHRPFPLLFTLTHTFAISAFALLCSSLLSCLDAAACSHAEELSVRTPCNGDRGAAAGAAAAAAEAMALRGCCLEGRVFCWSTLVPGATVARMA